jgi:hypothetical protein
MRNQAPAAKGIVEPPKHAVDDLQLNVPTKDLPPILVLLRYERYEHPSNYSCRVMIKLNLLVPL